LNLKPLYFGCKLLLALISIVVVALLCVMVWVSMGPRTINHLNDYIAHSILPEGKAYQLNIETSILQWDSWSKPLALHLKNTKLLKEDKLVTSWPELVITANVTSLLFGKVEAEQLLLANPRLSIVRDAEGDFYIQGDEFKIGFNELVAAGEHSGSTRLPIRNVAIYGADIDYEDQQNHLKLKAERASLEWSSEQDHQVLKADLPATMGMQQFDIALGIIRSKTEQSTLTLDLKKVNPYSVCQLVEVCTGFPELNIELSGNLELSMDANFVVQSVTGTLAGEKGTLAYAPNFPETLSLDSLRLEGKYDRAAHLFMLSNAHTKIGDMTLTASGEYKTSEQGPEVTLKGQAANMPINDLYKYWPSHKAPESRAWITSSIRDGIATEASIDLKLTPDDFKAEYISDAAIKAEVKLKDATVHYLKGFPEAKEVSGVVHFTGTTIIADTDHATLMKGTLVPKANFTFSDLNHPNVPLTITLSAEAPAGDVLELLSPPRFKLFKSRAIDFSQATGQTTGEIKLSFNTFREVSDAEKDKADQVNWDQVEYTVDAQLKDISGLSIKKTNPIQNANGTFFANKQELKLDLSGTMKEAPMQITVHDKGDGNSDVTLKGQFEVGQLVALGFPKRPEISGVVGADISLNERSGNDVFEADLDLTGTAIMIPDIKYQKPMGVKASLKVKPMYDARHKLLDDMTVNYLSDMLEFGGDVRFDMEKGTLASAQMDRIRYGRNDASLHYVASEDAPRLTIKGKAFDYAMLASEGDAMTISDFPAIQMDVDVGTLYLPKNQQLQAVKGHIHCGKVRCESANLAAGFAKGGDMSLKIYREGPARKFSLQSNNAGSLLQTFDVTDRMFEGGLDLSGDYDDSKSGNPLDGRLLLTDFVLKDAPILGRILNLSSLTGLVESLSGSGIRFDKLGADIVFVKDVATIKHAKATGPSLGILGKGNIDIKQSKIDMEGSLAPAYAINSVVSKIPLIGEALVGGEGEGVFAFSYSISGNVNEPSVIVNPLSLFTPGFMRKFFDIFDAPESAKPALKAAQEREAATGKPKQIMPPLTIEKPAVKPQSASKPKKKAKANPVQSGAPVSTSAPVPAPAN